MATLTSHASYQSEGQCNIICVKLDGIPMWHHMLNASDGHCDTTFHISLKANMTAQVSYQSEGQYDSTGFISVWRPIWHHWFHISLKANMTSRFISVWRPIWHHWFHISLKANMTSRFISVWRPIWHHRFHISLKANMTSHISYQSEGQYDITGFIQSEGQYDITGFIQSEGQYDITGSISVWRPIWYHRFHISLKANMTSPVPYQSEGQYDITSSISVWRPIWLSNAYYHETTISKAENLTKTLQGDCQTWQINSEHFLVTGSVSVKSQ